MPNHHEPRKKKHVLRGNKKLIITKTLPQDGMEGTLNFETVWSFFRDRVQVPQE